jgi:hypothetical protein
MQLSIYSINCFRLFLSSEPLSKYHSSKKPKYRDCVVGKVPSWEGTCLLGGRQGRSETTIQWLLEVGERAREALSIGVIFGGRFQGCILEREMGKRGLYLGNNKILRL